MNQETHVNCQFSNLEICWYRDRKTFRDSTFDQYLDTVLDDLAWERQYETAITEASQCLSEFGKPSHGSSGDYFILDNWYRKHRSLGITLNTENMFRTEVIAALVHWLNTSNPPFMVHLGIEAIEGGFPDVDATIETHQIRWLVADDKEMAWVSKTLLS